MNRIPKIIVADDDAAIVASLRLLLTNEGFEVQHANNPQEVLFLMEQGSPDLLLIDMNYESDTTSGQEGLALIEKLRHSDEQVPIVVMTGWATVDLAVAAMQQGANDFIKKPWDNQRLLNIINAQLKIVDAQKKTSRLTRENQILKDDLNSQKLPMVAQSSQMKSLLIQCQQAAQSDATILITGENGTGKSILAEYIHQHSTRAEKPFVTVNMGSIPESLFESELFGHAKGAFTDAKSRRLGRVELAEGGTLFLDEIGNLPLTQQSKLLHLLESKEFQSVGSSHSQVADVRIIAATNANLKEMVEQQTFRMDLLYRLNTLTVNLPALRQRSDDILPLAHSFCLHFAGKYQKPEITLSPHTQSALVAYHWPGNIRELSHVIERAVIFTENSTIAADALMLQDVGEVHECSNEIQTMAEIEKQTMTERLALFHGNANQAANSLGMSRSAFYRRLDKYKV